MNTRRPLLLAMLIAIAGLFAFQPAGAVITSGYVEDFTGSEITADTCTDKGYLMFSSGLVVGTAHAALFSAPPCFVQDGTEIVPQGAIAQTPADICTVGQVNAFLAPVGPGIEGSLVEYASLPLCVMPANLMQPVDAQDPRVCDADADLTLAHPCYVRD